MIIELFGPPGVGKTTFASALTSFLRERGHAVDPVISYRPAEQTPSSNSASGEAAPSQASASMRRLVRPAFEMMATTGHLFGHSQDAAMTAELMRLLPSRSLVWSIRLRQYLFRLAHSWHLAAASDHIVLFDQAFIQALCSLVLLGRTPDRTRIARALGIVPQADLLIRLDAPRDILAARLGERQRGQGMIEQLFELDLPTNLASGPIIDDLDALLRERGRPVIVVNSADRQALQAGVVKAGTQVVAQFARHPAPPAQGRQTMEQAQNA